MAPSTPIIDAGPALPFEKSIADLQQQILDLEADQSKTGRDYSPSNRMAKTLLYLWWNERCGVMWLSGLPIPALRTVHTECDSDGAYTFNPTMS